MKRKLALLLSAIFLLASLTGCGGKQIKDVPSEPTPSPTPTPKEFTLGTVTDNVYTSEYSNLQFTLPEGWTFATEEELINLMSDLLAYMDESDIYSGFHKRYAEMSSVYDMYAESPSGGSISLSYERMDILGIFSDMTAEEYVEQARENISGVYDEMFANDPDLQGLTYEVGEIETVEAAGKTFVTIPLTMMDGLFRQTYYHCRIDNRMLGIVITGDTEYDPADLLEYFSAYQAE